MAEERGDSDVDPRFDRRFQRGFDPGVRPTVATSSNVSEPPPIRGADTERPLEPEHTVSNEPPAEIPVIPRPSPFEIALYVLSGVLLLSCVAWVASVVDVPTSYTPPLSAWDAALVAFHDQAGPILAVGAVVAGVAGLAVGALRAGRPL